MIPVSSHVSPALDRTRLLDWFNRNRRRSAALFDLIDPAVYYERPITLRNPIVFYEGHLPAFNVIVLPSVVSIESAGYRSLELRRNSAGRRQLGRSLDGHTDGK